MLKNVFFCVKIFIHFDRRTSPCTRAKFHREPLGLFYSSYIFIRQRKYIPRLEKNISLRQIDNAVFFRHRSMLVSRGTTGRPRSVSPDHYPVVAAAAEVVGPSHVPLHSRPGLRRLAPDIRCRRRRSASSGRDCGGGGARNGYSRDGGVLLTVLGTVCVSAARGGGRT